MKNPNYLKYRIQPIDQPSLDEALERLKQTALTTGPQDTFWCFLGHEDSAHLKLPERIKKVSQIADAIKWIYEELKKFDENRQNSILSRFKGFVVFLEKDENFFNQLSSQLGALPIGIIGIGYPSRCEKGFTDYLTDLGIITNQVRDFKTQYMRWLEIINS